MFKEIKQFVNWVRRRNSTAHTWQDYYCDLHQFAATVGDKGLREITFKEVDTFIESQLKRQLTSSTINRRLAAVTSLYQFFMVEDDELDCPVIKYRHTLRAHQRLPRAVPQTDLEQLFAVIEDVRDLAIFLLMLRSGLRISEVAKMTLRDLYLEESRPRVVVHGKNSRDRSVYLSGQTVTALRRYLEDRPAVDAPAVFINCRNEPLTTMGIQKRLEKYRRLAGVHVTAHQLRHNFANDMVLADVPVTSIQKLLGHAWVGTTQLYIAANDLKVKADFFAAISKLEGWHGDQ